MSTKRLDRVITDAYAKSGFFKIRADSFGIDRLQMDFVSLDANDKATLTINIYVNIYKAVAFANDILNGRIAKLVDASKQKATAEGKTYPDAVWEDFGGMSVAAVKNAAKNRLGLQKFAKDNKAVSRILKLTPGNTQPFMFTALQSAGKEIRKGAIVPESGAQSERVMVAVDADKLKEIAYGILKEWDAYIAAQYQRDAYRSEWNNQPATGNNTSSSSGEHAPPPPPYPTDFEDSPL